MKKTLLPPEQDGFRYYRANLHCHSNISDGGKSPEQLKADYMAHGYSVIAFTDHDVFLQHNDLTDDAFLALNGFEVEINDSETVGNERKCCHMCFIAKDPDNNVTPCYNREKYFFGNAKKYRDLVHFDESKPDYQRSYTGECVNEMIEEGQKNGFFVTYNHPYWSLERYPDYMRYRKMNAMEIVNHSCVSVGYDDDNGRVYEDLLSDGVKCYCIAADDNHNRTDDTSPYCDSYGGYIMIGAEKLDYKTITEALEKGQFYTSTGSNFHVGPKFRSIEFENGRVTVRTSDVREIWLMTKSRSCRIVIADCGQTVNSAIFDVSPEEKWFRLVIRDTNGYKAYSNAFFQNDFR